jgi:alpha-L-fucosidase
VQLYFTSVGRNSKLLLNVPPTRDGRFHASDVASLQAMRAQLDTLFAHDLTAGTTQRVRATGAHRADLHIRLPRPADIGLLDLREDITRGQRVASYRVDAFDGTAWRELARGTTIGYRRLERVTLGAYSQLRVSVNDAIASPVSMILHCYRGV